MSILGNEGKVYITSDGKLLRNGGNTSASVKYTEQALTTAEKSQVRNNIGAVASQHGSTNNGKILGVGSDGNVTLVNKTNISYNETTGDLTIS